MSVYPISYLEQLSGIKAGTIRIWEQRYGILTPLRSEGNVRYYDDEELRKLLQISVLVESGIKISAIGKLTNKELNKKYLELEHHLNETLKNEIEINNLILAALKYDEQEFNLVFNACITKYGLKHTYILFIHPLLVRIGFLWGANELIPAQEHFISNLIRQKLFSAIESVKLKNKAPKWILYLPEFESHEIGLLFATYLLKLSGKCCIYLGQNVPFQNLYSIVESSKAEGILTFFVRKLPLEKMNQYVLDSENNFKKQELIFCVSKEIKSEIKSQKKTQIISNPNALMVWLNGKIELAK